jgi:hypothetical protein
MVYPASKNAKREFQRLVEGRNEFTHRGKIRDYERSLQDFHRLRYIVGVILLKLLDYPLDRLNEDEEDRSLARRK